MVWKMWPVVSAHKIQPEGNKNQFRRLAVGAWLHRALNGGLFHGYFNGDLWNWKFPKKNVENDWVDLDSLFSH